MKGRPIGSKSKSLHIWTEKEKSYLKEITQGRYHKEITELMNKKFEYKFNVMQIKGAIRRYKLNTGLTGQFKVGNIPYNKGVKGLKGANKTSFKKGQIPVNYRPVGSERVNIYGYTEIKVEDPNKWRLKHVVIWEKHNGPVQKGYNIIFGDGNKQNLDIDNLILVSKRQLLILNRKKLIFNDSNLTRVGLNVAKVYEKISERNKF